MRALAGLPAPLAIAVLIAAGMAAGALLLVVPALLRLRFGVDEVVTTLLLNFIVLLFVSMMIEGPLRDPMAFGWPQSVAVDSRRHACPPWSRGRGCMSDS